MNENNDVNYNLRAAAFEGNYKEVKILVGKGAKVNSSDDGGWTALHMAAQRAKDGLMETISTLLDAGADPRARAKTHKGYMNALMLLDERSLEEDNIEPAIKLLEQHGVDRPPAWGAKFRKTKHMLQMIRGK